MHLCPLPIFAAGYRLLQLFFWFVTYLYLFFLSLFCDRNPLHRVCFPNPYTNYGQSRLSRTNSTYRTEGEYSTFRISRDYQN